MVACAGDPHSLGFIRNEGRSPPIWSVLPPGAPSAGTGRCPPVPRGSWSPRARRSTWVKRQST